ncbi:NtaA/DmoA family FMN-dependent monooxygenase [Herbaspirillum autotrophicum]|uniref:NtaA/DmoA family FMN-dependent monooxygenase n=1 Tax=Herbaspirillum autotrophicum TaxID=180195 RepID=UPI00067DBC37|nr:NtaA/DmoA family FMN-dependent monooxygenase [Herbaspirillum autotrophicum]
MTEKKRKQLHLGLMFWATGTHSAGWRHPLAKTDGAYDIEFIQQISAAAERAKFDFIFLGDRLVADPALAKTNPGQMSRLEPFVVASAIAAATDKIGLVVTTNTTYNDPYTVARMATSLDYISKGRASWNIVTGADAAAALNFSRGEHWSNEKRYDWAQEFTEAAIRLWQSWEEDAYAPTPDGGAEIRLDRINNPAYEGQHIRFDAPLNLPRPPQGYPVLLHAGTSERSRDLGGRYADVLFTGQAVFAEAKEYYDDVKGRARQYGRNPDDVKIIPGLIVVVEETTEQAVATYDTLNKLILLDPEDSPEALAAKDDAGKPHFQYVGLGRGAKRNLSLASGAIGVDVRGHALTDLVPPETLAQASDAGKDIFAYITRLTRRTTTAAVASQRITYLDLVHASIAQTSAVVGNPQEVADYMQYWLDNGAADGFNIFASFLPYSADRFNQLVVPELQRRGIYRQDYAGDTLREHFNQPKPV